MRANQKSVAGIAWLALAAALTIGPRCMGAQETPRSPESVVRAYVEAMNSKSVEGLLATTADLLDVRVFKADGSIQSQLTRSRDDQKKSFEIMLKVNPDAKTRIISLVVSGAVVVERSESTHLPGGLSVTGLCMYRVIEGRITQLWILNDEGVAREAS